MSEDSGGPKDPDDEDTDKVVVPFRRRWKSGSGEPHQTLADGTVMEHMERGWASWIFGGYPVVQNTCVACLRHRREEHEACGFEDCDCFCTAGKLWPLWALFGLAPPRDKPIPPQLLGLREQEGEEQAEEAEGGEAEDVPRSAHRRHLWAAVLAVAVLVLGSGGVALVEHFQKVNSEALTRSKSYGSLGVRHDLGERKAGLPMPHKPLPNQAVAPCRAPAKELYGSCWIGPMKAPAPCQPGEYEEGGECYVPETAADSKAPVGE